MCEPVSIMLGISAALAVAGSVAQGMEQDNQAQQQNKQYLDNAKVAANSKSEKERQNNARQTQENMAAVQQQFEASVEAGELESTMALSANESGAQGRSMGLLLAEAEAEALRDQDKIEQNKLWTLSSLENEKKAYESQYRNQRNSVRKGKGANWTTIGLEIGATATGAAASASQAYSDNTPSKTKSSKTKTSKRSSNSPSYKQVFG